MKVVLNNNQGQAYQISGQPELALPHFLSAFEISVKHLGKDDPRTLGLIRNLANFFNDSKRYTEGAAEFQALLDQHSNLPPNHAISQCMHNSLADFYYGSGEFEKAVPLYSAKMQRIQDEYGSDHKTSLEMARVLSETMIQAEMYEDAKTVIEDLIQVLDSMEFADDQALNKARISLAETYVGLNRDNDAMLQLEMLQESEMEPIQKARFASLKGHLLALQGETKQAEQLLISSSQQIEREKGNLNFHSAWYLTAALQRTIDFFASNDRTEKADSWRKRLEGPRND